MALTVAGRPTFDLADGGRIHSEGSRLGDHPRLRANQRVARARSGGKATRSAALASRGRVIIPTTGGSLAHSVLTDTQIT